MRNTVSDSSVENIWHRVYIIYIVIYVIVINQKLRFVCDL